MSELLAIATYLPTWRASDGRPVAGPDEDAVTMAVAAGRAALAATDERVRGVVFVSRELPLLEGGNAAALLAGLGLSDATAVVEQLGGGPATLDAIATAPPGTLVVAAEVTPRAAASAALLGAGPGLSAVGRVHRSLPLRVRGLDGEVHEDHDPRLQRERGAGMALKRAALPSKPVVVAGLSARESAELCEGTPPELPSTGAASPIFALAALAEERRGGLVAAVEQASLAALEVLASGVEPVRIGRPGLPLPTARPASGPDIKFAYTAYERAFDSKLRWDAGCCASCGTLALPPRWRCLACGREGHQELVPLPRRGRVYTVTTVHTPVPGLSGPYSLVVVSLEGIDVRALTTVADAPPGTVDIDFLGTMVFRRLSTRVGVPDYGYAFQPDIEALETARGS